jgi:hypothetical protein
VIYQFLSKNIFESINFDEIISESNILFKKYLPNYLLEDINEKIGKKKFNNYL